MNWIEVGPNQARELADAPAEAPQQGFLWLDVRHEELGAAPEALRALVERLSGVRIFDLHLKDALNLQHPSYFDSTRNYEMLVFRKLSMAEAPAGDGTSDADRGRILQQIVTRPITFFVLEKMLVTIRSSASRTIELVRNRLLQPRAEGADTAAADRMRLPRAPEELMLRLINGMVDRYLGLRQPRTDRLEAWQHELLDPRRPFRNWIALLEARTEVRKLEHLSEEQYDALQELRDEYLESNAGAALNDAFLVRLNDVMEHIQRVLNHARRLEATAESAVQLHFSAMTHRTNQIVRTLTVITAIFAPLSLISGVFGMNFKFMPLLDEREGFWWTVAFMVGLAVLLLVVFWTRRIIVDRPGRSRLIRWIDLSGRRDSNEEP
jgi:Mg2+ and Co2+ transporter CorA